MNAYKDWWCWDHYCVIVEIRVEMLCVLCTFSLLEFLVQRNHKHIHRSAASSSCSVCGGRRVALLHRSESQQWMLTPGSSCCWQWREVAQPLVRTMPSAAAQRERTVSHRKQLPLTSDLPCATGARVSRLIIKLINNEAQGLVCHRDHYEVTEVNVHTANVSPDWNQICLLQ